MIHIGKKIEEAFVKRGCTKTWLAEQINCDHSNINHIFKRQSIDTELLVKLSNALGVNFFEYYLQELNSEKFSHNSE